jgi:hypothetical protein
MIIVALQGVRSLTTTAPCEEIFIDAGEFRAYRRRGMQRDGSGSICTTPLMTIAICARNRRAYRPGKVQSLDREST